ncbi:MAG: dockerin type I repeat-containing protein [Candidatus Levybacteria bacterium]|nr:dockerin type I repeat-containing protein [Candidatus Levybacteria bacterium]
MGSIKNAFKFIFSPTASRTTSILVILVIAAAVPLTVLVSQKQQELRQHAQSTQQVSVSIQECKPPFNVFVGKYCSADLALQNVQNDPENFNLKVVESSNAILPEDLTLCNNGKDPVYYVYEKGKAGNPCTATDPASRQQFPGICNDRGNCDGTITLLPTPNPPIVGDYPTSTPTPTPSLQRCDSADGSVRTDGANQYVCSSQPPPAESNCQSTPSFSCVNPSDGCYICPVTSTTRTSPPPPPTSTPAPAASAGQAAPPPTTPSGCPLKSKGDANCDGKVNILDYNILRDEFTHKLQTRTADFNSNNVIDDLDLSIWKNSMQDSNIQHY